MKNNRYFNPNGDDSLNELLFASNGTGITDFNNSRYNWAIKCYEGMENNSWFVKEVNTMNAKKEYLAFSEIERMRYNRGFSQLSVNDSFQEDFLIDIRAHTSNKLVRTLLTFQAYQEGLHSKGYSNLLELSGNVDEVRDLYKTDEALLIKNTAIAEQFGRNIEGTTADKLLLSACASIAMECIYFQLGFANIYLFGKEKASAAIDMVQFIARDELETHLPIFTNIFKTMIRENKIDNRVISQCYDIIDEAVNIELAYGRSLFKDSPVLGVTDDIMSDTIKNYANERLRAMGLERLYPLKPQTTLQKLVTDNRKMNEKKGNFFEANVKNYAKNVVDMNDF